MRARNAALLFIALALAWAVPQFVVLAAVLDSQADDSAHATRPAAANVYLALGYVPPQSESIYGVRFRVNTSGSGDYICPVSSAVMKYSGTTTPPTQWGDSNNVVGRLVNVGTTTPDANGNCDYTTLDKFDNDVPLSLSPNHYYVFFMTTGGSYTKWVSVSGKPYTSATPSLFGFRHAFLTAYEWGTTGLDAPYFEFYDTVPPAPPPPPDPCATPGVCASNVLFLPGIEGSRLYEGVGCGGGAEEKLWEPFDSLIGILRGAGDDKVKKLFLDSSGASICGDVYTKTDDIIDSAGGNIYKSFVDEMNGMKTDGTITAWKAAAYDWRLSLSDLLEKGAERDDKIYYAGVDSATSTPYIEQTLRSLAGSSKTKKVTIVAHSNGGLVAKALLAKLGDAASAALVDKVIMVGAPQSAAPLSLGTLLVGHDSGIYYKNLFTIVSNAAARELAINSPMAYHLLPSESYLSSIASDTNHPVARFKGAAYAKESATYGASIDTRAEMDDFILAESLNSVLVDYANSQHATLDSWLPPEGIDVSQIAGWGADTVAGIDFYTPPPINALTALEPMRAYRPIFTEDGDGVVPVPSALMMPASTNVKRYWVNLETYRVATSIKRSHRDIFEIPSVEDFIKNIISNSTSTLPAYIGTSQPAPLADNKKLIFLLHSPLTLQLTDASGNVTGLAEDSSMTQDIPGSTYAEFGEVKYIIAPQGISYTLTLHGQDSGAFSLDIQEYSGGVVTSASTIANVPTTANTLASLTITNGLDTASALTVDKNGDGAGIISLTPKVGETVSYVEPRRSRGNQSHVVNTPSAATTSPVDDGLRSAGTTSFLADSGLQTAGTLPENVETVATSTEATTTPLVATSTPEIATSTNIVQEKKKSLAINTTRKPDKVAIPVSKANVAQTPLEVRFLTGQTASVYDASQQSVLKKLGEIVYNSLHRLWRGFKRMLLIES